MRGIESRPRRFTDGLEPADRTIDKALDIAITSGKIYKWLCRTGYYGSWRRRKSHRVPLGRRQTIKVIKDGTSRLTPAHITKLAALARYIDENDYGPSVRDMKQIFRIASTGNVYYYTKIWLQAGLISAKRVGERQMVVGYTIRLTDAGRALIASRGAEKGNP